MLRRSPLLLASLLPILTVACGNVLVEPNGGSGSGGSTSTGTTTSVTTGTGTTTTSTTTSGSGGSGGSGVCGETKDGVSMLLSTFDGKSFGCKGGSDGTFEMNATVVDTGAELIALDSCPPNADCLPQVSKLAISAPGLYAGSMGKGAFVRLEIQSFHFMGGCSQKVQILNLPQWGGAPNPIDHDERLWLLAADGDTGTFEDSPLSAEIVPLGCYPDEPPGCGDHDDYLWRFRSALNPDDPGFTLPMGATGSWGFKSGAFSQLVLARNLRAFSLGYCDGPSEFAYWITNDYGLD